MGRSPGFGSTARDYNPLRGHALFRLAFAAAPGVTPLASPQTVTRRLILQKARHQPAHNRSHAPRPLTVCRSTVSGSISLPFRGSFLLSLTVLFTIGHQEYLALRSGLRGFPQDFACPGVLGCHSRVRSVFVYRAVTFCGLAFHQLRLTAGFVTRCEPSRARRVVPQHRARNGCRLGTRTVWAAPFSIASTKGISLPPGTKMFQFPGCPLPGLCVQPGVPGHYSRRVAPFGYHRISVRFQLPGAFRR
jgi:hypothetical protein